MLGVFRKQSVSCVRRQQKPLLFTNALSLSSNQFKLQRRNISFTASTVPPVIKSFINGQYVESTSGETFDVYDPATGNVMTTMQVAGQAEVDLAVEAAAAAQVAWGQLTGIQRSEVLRKAADKLASYNDDIAAVEAKDTGRSIAETSIVDVVCVVDALNYMASSVTTLSGEHIQQPDNSFAYTRREPLGVTAGIGAWNYPIQSAGWKAAPSLACGNAIIFKPAEDTPLSALLMAETLVEAGLPAGLFNVVLGTGNTGGCLSAHKGIAKISFTGSVPTGKKVYESAAATVKRVTLELGGKSPLIIFPDANLRNAVSGAMMANFYSNGEVCSNGTRVFVHHSIKQQFIEQLLERTAKMKVGEPLDASTDIGPMVSERHMNKVLHYIDVGKKEGAKLLYGGERVKSNNGYYLTPAIFDECTDGMSIVQEEVFGMLMAILSFDSEDEVLTRANATEYGLSAGVFTQDITRAHRMVAQLQAGTTWINNYNLAPADLPWGGYKQSGIGRENGSQCVNEWSQIKSCYVEMNDVWCPY